MARPHHTSDKIPFQTREPLSPTCLRCGKAAHIAYHTQRTVATLTGRHRFHLIVRRSLKARGLSIGERTVLNLIARYEALVTLHMTDRERLQPLVQKQESLILAVDGLKPDVGHEVL